MWPFTKRKKNHYPIPRKETDLLMSEICNSMVRAEKEGLTGKEKEASVITELFRIVSDPKILPSLVSLFGPTKMIPLTVFVTRSLIRILNIFVGHDWLFKSKNIKDRDK